MSRVKKKTIAELLQDFEMETREAVRNIGRAWKIIDRAQLALARSKRLYANDNR